MGVMMRLLLGTVVTVLFLCVACGEQTGDPCTVDSECPGARCLQGEDFPGGYCSATCSDDSQCDDGEVCVDARGRVCLLECDEERDCSRDGYACKPFHDEDVCIGEAAEEEE